MEKKYNILAVESIALGNSSFELVVVLDTNVEQKYIDVLKEECQKAYEYEEAGDYDSMWEYSPFQGLCYQTIYDRYCSWDGVKQLMIVEQL